MPTNWPLDGVSHATWTGMSQDHLWAARHLVELARREEQRGEVGAHHDAYRRHRSYVVGAVIGAACFLESAINETFSDVAEHGHSDVVPACDPRHRDVLGGIWSPGIERLSVLEKYDLALAVGLRPSIPKGEDLYANVKLTIGLRNALVHYKPEWVYGNDDGDVPSDVMHRFEKRLRGRFSLNPLAKTTYPFWPDRCLSAACAGWAADSVEAFVKRFRELMDPEGECPPIRR